MRHKTTQCILRASCDSFAVEVKGKRFLDAACACGFYSEWLIARGAEVVAVDASPEMVELTRRFNYTYFKSKKYFQTELVGSVWRGFETVRVHMPSYRRSLEETLNPVIEAGFRLEKILEPRPTEEFKRADPEDYAELMEQPSFLCLRAEARALRTF